ncbi:RNA-directed DNA polymerase, eukaryota, reverse transcriptase zinc-binding domain protein [Tanacetum coccineum]
MVRICLSLTVLRLDYRVGRPPFSPLVAALLSSNLCSVSLVFYLSIFKVPEKVVKSLESLRASFFLGSSKDSKKLASVKWSNILASLDKEGIGVGSLKAFNMSLLLKWRWRLFHNSNALWVHVGKAIHGDETCIDIRDCHTNGVWASIVRLIFHLHSSGIVPLNFIRFKVGDGSSICFWNDTCRPVNVGKTKAKFDAFIFDIITLQPEELVDSDTCIWSLSHDDKFSVNSVRKHIDKLPLPPLSPSTRWCTIIPKKVNIFMCQMFLDRLPNHLNLSSRGLDIDSIMCPVCNVSMESSAYTFFSCDTASAVWQLVRVWSGSMFPFFSSCGEWDLWFQSWHALKEKKDRAYAIFVASCWALWRIRNNITFNSHSMRKSDIFGYICLVSFSWLKFRSNLCIS